MAELLIAWRYIKAKRKEKAISAIATFSILGIALGVATLIIVTSVMNGFRKEFTDRVIGFNGHLTLYPFEQSIDYCQACESVSEIDEILQAIPSIERHALISNGKVVSGVMCQGISPENLQKKELIAKNIVAGYLEDFSHEDAIALGDSLAINNGLFIGDDVVIIAPELDKTGFGILPRKKTFKLVAIFKSGMYEYDNSIAFISLDMAQKLFKLQNAITNISIFVKDPEKIQNVKDHLYKNFGKNFRITDWQQNNSSFMRAVEVERNVMFLILTLIVLVASFNIISCMIMLVKDKENDIAILRTIGLSRFSISKIFFMVGSFMGITGTSIGFILGLCFTLNIQKIQAVIEGILKTKVFSPEVYFLTHLPAIVQPFDVAVTVFVSILLSCLAALYPARKAGRLAPTEILRYA